MWWRWNSRKENHHGGQFVAHRSFARHDRSIVICRVLFLQFSFVRLTANEIFSLDEKRGHYVSRKDDWAHQDRRHTHIQTMIQQSNLKLTGALSSSSQKSNRKANIRRSAMSEYRTRAFLFVLGRNATLERQSRQLNESLWFLPIMHGNKFKKQTSTQRLLTSEKNHRAIVR